MMKSIDDCGGAPSFRREDLRGWGLRAHLWRPIGGRPMVDIAIDWIVIVSSALARAKGAGMVPGQGGPVPSYARRAARLRLAAA